MAKKKQVPRFPIFSSPFSPKTIIVVVGIIGGLLAVNFTSFQQYQRDEQAQATKATKNLLTKVNLLNVLGSSIETDLTLNEETQFRKKTEVKYWYDIVSQRSDYRDAYIVLATLAYNDHRCQLAQTHLSQAFALDPNLRKDTPLNMAVDKCGKQ